MFNASSKVKIPNEIFYHYSSLYDKLVCVTNLVVLWHFIDTHLSYAKRVSSIIARVLILMIAVSYHTYLFLYNIK